MIILITFLIIVIFVMAIVIYILNKNIIKKHYMGSRYKQYYNILTQWIKNKNRNRNISSYLKNKNINSIAIYGMGELGIALYEELKDTDIRIIYLVDKNANHIYYGVNESHLINVDEVSAQEEVDAIIVTPIYDYDKIKETLVNGGVKTNIISLENIIYDL
ncbi:MAG: hypothetical protein PWP27_626 [Clostridiales bacterium]|nr:hypothetical protein [Clostridiales bacterium]